MSVDWSGLLPAGGAVGVGLIISNSYHNYQMRKHTRRIAEALEPRGDQRD